jgi:hypothetical protein
LDTWKQATSYCDTLFGLFEFCGWLPAYMLPAMPPFSLNAEPGADAACPGSSSAVLERQVWLGCPVPDGFPDAKTGAAVMLAIAALILRIKITIRIGIPFSVSRAVLAAVSSCHLFLVSPMCTS